MVGNGIDNKAGLRVLEGRRLGLVTNPTGVDRELRSTAEILKASFRLAAVFGPEHGIRGDQQAGVEIDSDGMDPELGVPSYSLYGAASRPDPAMLDGLDAMVYDIQDVGARFYTYIYTLAHTMEACADKGIPVIVLDRVNPLGGLAVEGISLEDGIRSGVGEYPMPVRYALTPGEFAMLINAEHHIGCSLHVVPCEGWSRGMWYGDTGLQWISPSPNIPTPESALAYIGTCIFEGTDISEGRGTTRPFELIGAPQLDAARLAADLARLSLPGVAWRPVHFTPTFSKHANELCHGVQVHVTDREAFRPFESGLRLFECIREQYPEMACRRHLDCLLGSSSLRLGTESVSEIIARAKKESGCFSKASAKYRLY